MKVKIKRLLKTVSLPQYHTKDSAGFDLSAAADVVIPAGAIAKVPTGLVIAAPKGHFLLIAARSSLSLKKGLTMANGIGIIDPDYAGHDDEISIILYNFTSKPVSVKKGERLAQGVFLPAGQAKWQEAKNLKQASRGGFGSTGGYK